MCAVAMRQPSGSDHKKNDDLDNEEQDLDMLEFDGVLLQDRCAAPASPNLLATAAPGPFWRRGVTVCVLLAGRWKKSRAG